MAYEGDTPEMIVPTTGGRAGIPQKGVLDWRWFIRWVLLTTAAIPAAFILAPPLSAIGISIQKLVMDNGLVRGDTSSFLTLFGFITAFALTLSTAEWYLLRGYLPRSRDWFLATAVGLFAGGLIGGSALILLSSNTGIPVWVGRLAVIPAGFGLGLAQWLVLRRTVPKAFWIIVIDGLALGSILLSGESITNLTELIVILVLPGTITGLGMWLLLRTSQHDSADEVSVQAGAKAGLPRILRIGLGLAALVPLFFGCSWAYATSQIALAKNDGVYTTPEEAVIAKNSQGWGGASVVKLENVRAEPNNPNGKQPHIWFGFAEVFLDKVPEGWDRTQYTSGSFYVHVRDGWVHMGEGAFPEFVGWVMELYNLEGTRDWIQAR